MLKNNLLCKKEEGGQAFSSKSDVFHVLLKQLALTINCPITQLTAQYIIIHKPGHREKTDY